MDFSGIMLLILFTLIPFFELRASIPLGLLNGSIALPFGLTLNGLGMDLWLVFFVCVATNIILGPVIYFLLDKFFHLFFMNSFLSRYYNAIVRRTQRRIEPKVEKYGVLGVALFIAIPLPGSGSYAGALGAYLIGLGYKKFLIANAVGVVIAAFLVTLITIGFFELHALGMALLK